MVEIVASSLRAAHLGDVVMGTTQLGLPARSLLRAVMRFVFLVLK